jgi:hypothetical protein
LGFFIYVKSKKVTIVLLPNKIYFDIVLTEVGIMRNTIDISTNLLAGDLRIKLIKYFTDNKYCQVDYKGETVMRRNPAPGLSCPVYMKVSYGDRALRIEAWTTMYKKEIVDDGKFYGLVPKKVFAKEVSKIKEAFHDTNVTENLGNSVPNYQFIISEDENKVLTTNSKITCVITSAILLPIIFLIPMPIYITLALSGTAIVLSVMGLGSKKKGIAILEIVLHLALLGLIIATAVGMFEQLFVEIDAGNNSNDEQENEVIVDNVDDESDEEEVSTDIEEEGDSVPTIANGSCTMINCINYISLDNDIDEVSDIIGFEPETDDNKFYYWRYNEDDYISIYFPSDSISSISVDIDNSNYENSQVDFSKYNEFKTATDEDMFYDDVKSYFGNVEGYLTDKSKYSEEYIWVNSDGEYIKCIFSSGELSFYSAFLRE